MANDIHKSEYMAWDAKTGNLTQATTRGATLTDVITIPTSAALSAGDVVWLKNYKSSTVITEMYLASQEVRRTKDVKVSVCLLGIDALSKEPFLFKYSAGGDPMLCNFSTSMTKGTTTDTNQANTPFILAKAATKTNTLAKASLLGATYRGNADTTAAAATAGTDGVAEGNANKVWRTFLGDQTIAQIAEYSMANMTDLAGVATNTAANGYDPSARKGYTEFGLGLVISAALSADELAAAGLKVIIRYKDTMLSESSYGLNYIPATVTY